MAQSTILASGTTAATSTDIVIAAGDSVTVGIFSADANDITDGSFSINQVTPGAVATIGSLNLYNRSTQLFGPGTFRVKRPVLTTAFGVFLDA